MESFSRVKTQSKENKIEKVQNPLYLAKTRTMLSIVQGGGDMRKEIDRIITQPSSSPEMEIVWRKRGKAAFHKQDGRGKESRHVGIVDT